MAIVPTRRRACSVRGPCRLTQNADLRMISGFNQCALPYLLQAGYEIGVEPSMRVDKVDLHAIVRCAVGVGTNYQCEIGNK